MTIYYQIVYQLGGKGKAHQSFAAALRDLHSARVSAGKGGDCQGITLRKYSDRYSDMSDTVQFSDAEWDAVLTA